MWDSRRIAPLIMCAALAVVALLLPFRPAAPPPPPPPPVSPPPPPPPQAVRANPEALLHLGTVAQVRVGLGQGLVPQDAGVEVDLAVEIVGQAQTGRTSRVMVLCLDRSGSMSGGNIRQARAAAAQLIQSLSEEDEVAVVAFGSQPGIEVPLRRATLEGKRTALGLVDALDARGGTDLHGGLRLAIQEAQHGTAAVRRVVLISDGVPTEGDVRPASILELARGASARGTVITTVAVGSQSPGGLMERVATASGGSYRYVRDGAGLHHVLATELEESSAVAAQEARLAVVLPPGVRLTRLGGASADATEGRLTINVGDVVAGQTRNLLLTLRIPSAGAATWQFPVTASARQRGVLLEAPGEVTALTSTDAAAVANSVVPWVRLRGQMVGVAQEVREAAQRWEQGDRSGGRSALEKAAARMEEEAARNPGLAAPARKLREFATKAAAEGDTRDVANQAHEQAFTLAR